MLFSVASRTYVLLAALGAFFVLPALQEVQAQAPQQGGQGQYGQPQDRGRGQPPGRGQAQGGQQGEQRRPPQVRQESEPFIHGLTVAVGLAVYQGDFSRNPEHNPVKYLAGSGKLSARVGVDHRLGRFDQYGLGADLVYNRISGEGADQVGFTQDALALDFFADYELPYIQQGLFRVFVGGGPNLIISPSYEGVPRVQEDENYQRLDTRVMGSLKVGVTIYDRFRIGTRIASSDLLDGYKGFQSDGVPDFISFLNFGYRFNLK